MSPEMHLTPEELLMAADGELPASEQARVDAHLAACWVCRSRKQEQEAAIESFVRFHQDRFADRLPAADGPRALLQARLRQVMESEGRPKRWFGFLRQRLAFGENAGSGLAWSVVWGSLMACGAAMLLWYGWANRAAEQAIAVTVPNHALTPGATIALDRVAVCRETSAKNKRVSNSVRREVFAEYGISAAHPDAYEVDYLITPALGGADDIHNLWPESTRTAGWNAQTKDELEDYLRGQVCEGKVDLATAQREISSDWIEAYKKYFRTDRPFSERR